MDPEYSQLQRSDEEEEYSRPKSALATNSSDWKAWTRIVIELSIAVALLFMVVIQRKQYYLLTRPKPSIMPEFSTKNILFRGQTRFGSAESFETDEKLHETMREWESLSSNTRGTIYLDPWERYGLPPPYNMSQIANKYNINGPADVYMVSVFHQLHCLSNLMISYGHLVVEGRRPKDLDHDAHCFDYLRQSILCAGDTTIEGMTEYGHGWGSVHQCKDIEAIRNWVDNKGGLPFGNVFDVL